MSPDNRLGSKADAIMLWYWVRKKSSLKRGTLQVRLSNCGFCDHRSPHFHACAAPRRCDEVSGQRTVAMVQWRKVCRDHGYHSGGERSQSAFKLPGRQALSWLVMSKSEALLLTKMHNFCQLPYGGNALKHCGGFWGDPRGKTRVSGGKNLSMTTAVCC